jgi:Transposase DDE domain
MALGVGLEPTRALAKGFSKPVRPRGRRRSARMLHICLAVTPAPLGRLLGGFADCLHTLIPRETSRWKALYRSRGGVEREFGRLKHEWALLPLRVRRIERVALHVDLTILTRLASALTEAGAIRLAA